MLWSTQTILWLYWKAAPKYECYKGHAGPDKKNEIFYRLEQEIYLDNQYNIQWYQYLTGSSPRSRLFITKKRSSHGVIIILADYEWICALLFLFQISHPLSPYILTLLSRSTSDVLLLMLGYIRPPEHDLKRELLDLTSRFCVSLRPFNVLFNFGSLI